MRKIAAMVMAAALVAVSMGFGSMGFVSSAGATDYEDPFFLNWPTYLPSSSTDYTVSESNTCKNGQVQCVDNVIREMTKRFNRLGCDHDATFAFTYLLTTEEYRKAVEDPNFFTDNAFVNHQDAIFADYYFDNFDDWHAGRIEQVAPAWRIAFNASDAQTVTGMGSVLLGMNAHVNRDLPFVLAEIGLVKPDGTTRKVDHNRVNDFLNATNKYLLTEAAKHLDPTLDDGDVPGVSLDNSLVLQMLVSWRENGWRNAERLAAAPTAEARAQVAQEIEQMAALEALTIRSAYSYTALDTLLGKGAKARNKFCTANNVPR